MRKIKSRQQDIQFIYCPYPMTLDKSKDFGTKNIQLFPNGAFLKCNEQGIVTHGVQPDSNKMRPVGWEKQANGLFRKLDIWILKELNFPATHFIKTLDGDFKYDVKEASVLVCQDANGKPDQSDTWIITQRELEKSYEL